VVDHPPVENHQEASNTDDIVLDNELVISDREIASLEEDYIDWDVPNIDF
jgi:hypothetical protein